MDWWICAVSFLLGFKGTIVLAVVIVYTCTVWHAFMYVKKSFNTQEEKQKEKKRDQLRDIYMYIVDQDAFYMNYDQE